MYLNSLQMDLLLVAYGCRLRTFHQWRGFKYLGLCFSLVLLFYILMCLLVFPVELKTPLLLRYLLGWYVNSKASVARRNMAVVCWIFLKECSVHHINRSMGLLVISNSIKHLFTSFIHIVLYSTKKTTDCFRGVCISDMIPFYLGKLFRQSGASADVTSRVSCP